MKNIFWIFFVDFFLHSKSRFFLSLASIALGIALFTSTLANSYKAEKSLIDHTLGYPSDEIAGRLLPKSSNHAGTDILKIIYDSTPSELKIRAQLRENGEYLRKHFGVVGRDVLDFRKALPEDQTKSKFDGIWISKALHEEFFSNGEIANVEICNKSKILKKEEVDKLETNGRFLLIDIVTLNHFCYATDDERISEIYLLGEKEDWKPYLGKFEGYKFESKLDVEERAGQALGSLKINLTIIALVSVLISFFMVANSLTGVYYSQKKNMGILLTLGMSRAENLSLFFIECLILGIMGSIIGIGLGHFVHSLPIFQSNSTLTDPQEIQSYTKLPWVISFQALGVGILGSLGSFIYPAIKTYQLEAIEIVSERQKDPVKLPLLAMFLISLVLGTIGISLAYLESPKFLLPSLLGVGLLIVATIGLLPLFFWLVATALSYIPRLEKMLSLFLAVQESKVEYWRYSLIGSTLVLAISLVFTLNSLTDSYRESIVGWVEKDSHFDGSLIEPLALEQGRPGIPLGFEKDLYSLGYLTSIEPFAIQPKVLVGNQIYTIHAISFPLEWDKSKIAVSKNLCYLDRFCEGKTLPLASERKGLVNLTIQATKEHFFSERGTIIMDTSLYQELFFLTHWSSIRFSFVDGKKNFQKLNSDLETLHPKVRIFDERELKELYLNGMDKVFRSLSSLKSTAILLAILTLFSSLYYGIQDKRRLLAGLAALGLEKRDIFSFLTIQTLILLIIGLMWGFASSLLISRAVVFGVNKNAFGWDLVFDFPWSLLWQLGIGILPLSIAVSWPIYQKLTKGRMAEELNYE